MKTQDIIDLCKKHTLFSWAAVDAVNPLPIETTEEFGCEFAADGQSAVLT